MTKGDWLILTRTNHLLKPIPAILKRQGLFFETAQGNSISKSFYEDIQTWNELLQGAGLGQEQGEVRERTS